MHAKSSMTRSPPDPGRSCIFHGKICNKDSPWIRQDLPCQNPHLILEEDVLFSTVKFAEKIALGLGKIFHAKIPHLILEEDLVSFIVKFAPNLPFQDLHLIMEDLVRLIYICCKIMQD